MAIDSLREVRRAGVARMKATAPLIAIVPAASIFPQTAPSGPLWPFVKWGAFTALPRRAACLDGATLIGAVHGFARTRKAGTVTIETGEDHASRLASEIARALDGHTATIAGGVASFLWTGTQLLQEDGEADDYHAVVNFRVRCSTV